MIYQVSYKTYLYGVYRTINTFILAKDKKALDLELGSQGIVFYEAKEIK